MWFQRKELNSIEYDTLVKRLSTCESKLNSLEIENETLRNKVLRKIQTKRDEILSKEEENKPKVPQSLNTFSPFG